MRRISNRRGFTLIELLVVIAIIAILAAILFPVFAQAREQARKTACLSNCKQIGMGMQMYAQDYDEMLPGWPDPSKHPLAGVWGWSIVVPLINNYTKSAAIWSCPSGPKTAPYIKGPTAQKVLVNYGYNEYIYNNKHAVLPSYAGNWNSLAALGGTQAGIANIAVVSDAAADGSGATGIFNDWSNYDKVNPKSEPADFGLARIKYSNGWTSTGGAQRHPDWGANIVFADSHAKFVQGTKLRGSYGTGSKADVGGFVEWPVVNPRNLPPQ